MSKYSTPKAMGTLGFGGITSIYATLVSFSGNCRSVTALNDTNADVVLSFDAGSRDHQVLKSGDRYVKDFIRINNSISAKALGAAPTVGSLYCTLFQDS
jgi:hypothetical protein